MNLTIPFGRAVCAAFMRAGVCVAGFTAYAAIAVGCAAQPEKIAPANIPVEPYLQMSCEQLSAERTKTQTALTEESREQRSVRRSDAWGVALVGMPVGRMSGGNREAKIAKLKGEAIAIDSASRTRDCPPSDGHPG